MITTEQRNERKKFLGSSDAAAIMGLSKWKNPADIFWEKIRAPSDNVSEPHNDAIQVGTLCEGAVLDWFAQETGKPLERNVRRLHANGIMAANFDAMVIGENEAVEAKTTGITGPLNKEEWGEIGTDEVPDQVIVQCQHQMAVLPEIQVVWVPVLLGGVGFRMYKVERNEALIRNMESIEVNFWNNYVLTKTPPPDEIPSMETIKRIVRVPNKTVELDDTLVTAWLEAKEAASAADKVKELVQRELFAQLGDAEAGTCSLGNLTCFEQTRKECVVKASTFRVARFTKNK